MTSAEKSYRSVMMRLGFTMLAFYGLTSLQSLAAILLPLFTQGLSAAAATILTELVSAVCYVLIFTLPVLFFKLISGKQGVAPMRVSLQMPRNTLLYVFFGVALNTSIAYLNSVVVSVFDYNSFSDEVLWGTDVSSNYELVLMFLSLAVIPAFVEEFLFRGLVLENLLPYGQTTAIFASAMLFGLMHQNAGQMLYATMAGVVLGWIYVTTRSIWPCVLMHFVNNFQSVLQTGMAERLPPEKADMVLNAMQGAILLLGILSAVLIFCGERDQKKKIRKTGVFTTSYADDAEYTASPISIARRVRLFFTPPMIVFVALCVFNMVLLILTALFLY